MDNALVCVQPRQSETENSWSDLPPELLTIIVSQIFLSDRCNFNLVCKSWNLISPIPQSLPPPESPYFNSPCLMFLNWSNNSWRLFHSLYNQLYNLDFQELNNDAQIHFSKYGWLLMSRDGLALFFFNPFTKEKVELPPLTCSFYSVCFTSPPTSPDCTVVVILKSCLGDIEFGLLKVGDREWKSQRFYNTDDTSFWKSTCPPLYYNGVYYCLDGDSRNIFVFDPTKEKEGDWRWVPYKKTIKDDEEEEKECYKVYNEHYLVEVEGNIWGVFVTRKERRVRIQKLDSSCMRWIELESLGNKCLYVSPNGSFAETCTVNNGIADKIYFNKFHGKSGVLYSLKSRMYHSVEGNFAINDVEASGLVEIDYGAWIKPTV